MPRRRLYLTKAKGYRDPWVLDRSGLHLVRRRGETIVESVVSGSPAAGIGIKAGDEILSIGGRRASDLSLREFSRLFSPIGSSHRLKVHGERGEFETTLILPGVASSR
jgi:C-terminal processing protease CtpA/Prc